METVYLGIVIFLFMLAVFDLLARLQAFGYKELEVCL